MSGEQENVDGKSVEYKQISDEMQRLLNRTADFTVTDPRRGLVEPIDGYAKVKPIIIPGMEFRPAEDSGRPGAELRARTASGGLAPNARDFDQEFGETEDDGGPECAGDTDYEKLFAHRGEFSDSFDFVYGEHGKILGAVRPQEDADAEREREEVAGRYAESKLREIEKRIGSKIEQADTSHLHNDESILQRVKKIVMPQRRRVIHDDD